MAIIAEEFRSLVQEFALVLISNYIYECMYVYIIKYLTKNTSPYCAMVS